MVGCSGSVSVTAETAQQLAWFDAFVVLLTPFEAATKGDGFGCSTFRLREPSCIRNRGPNPFLPSSQRASVISTDCNSRFFFELEVGPSSCSRKVCLGAEVAQTEAGFCVLLARYGGRRRYSFFRSSFQYVSGSPSSIKEA